MKFCNLLIHNFVVPRLFNDIVIDINRNCTVILLLLDLSATFDTVDHLILFNRLDNRQIKDINICYSGV